MTVAEYTTAFNPEEIIVIFILGGPGAGKGTQCTHIKNDYDFVHLSAGDLLRDEQKREGSTYGELIQNCIRDGLIVPMEVTIALLEKAIRDKIENEKKTRFLVDGFPRKMDQAVQFESSVVEAKVVLYFDCPEEVLWRRLLKRGETSQRIDDNIDTIKKRFQTFKETSYPVIEAFREKGKVRQISSDQSIEAVYADVKAVLDEVLV